MAGRPLPWRTAVAIVLEAAKGLAAAHARGIVHRDIKPENIFVLAQGGVKILDFGLAWRAPERTATATAATPQSPDGHLEIAGTVAYLAPEQLAGAPADERSDIYSLGGVLFELLTGRAPFDRDTPTETIDAIANEATPRLAAPGRTIPAGLARIVRRCLNRDPASRFQTAYDLAFALNEQLAAPPELVPRRAEWLVRAGWFIAGAAVAAACLLLLR
jgi:serine/threonine protein kinase